MIACSREASVSATRADDRLAAPQSFGVNISIVFAHAGLRERADDTARNTPGSRLAIEAKNVCGQSKGGR
jgi:hypothetical protein